MAAVPALEAVDSAVSEATTRCVGWRTLPADLPWQRIIDPEREHDGSLSSGSVASGVLLNAVELEASDSHHSIIERHRTYGTSWGTNELVELIKHAARHVAETEGGAPLRVGNMSRKRGGDIRWSNSHNSGRDADLAFYVLDAQGNSVPAPDLVAFIDGEQAERHDDLTFDTARNWRLVEGLLSHPEIDVQWLFISIPLKNLLLEHGRRIGADAEILTRAESVLHQPTDSSPHNDHFHLRITCPKADRLDGCEDYGPRWAWVDWHEADLLARALRLAEAFEQPRVELRVRALDFLASTRNPYGPDVALVWGVWDDDDQVVGKALDVVDTQWSWSANALVQVAKFIRSERAGTESLERLYSVLRRSHDEIARNFALERLAASDVAVSERGLAARALGHFMEPELVPILIEHLITAPAPVRAEIAAVLRRIANRAEEIEWTTADEAAARAAVARWRTWWNEHGAMPRDQWLADGFTRHGITVSNPVGIRDVDALLASLPTAPPHILYNANRTMRELTGRWAPLEQDDGQRLHDHWSKWWKKNRERVLAGET